MSIDKFEIGVKVVHRSGSGRVYTPNLILSNGLMCHAVSDDGGFFLYDIHNYVLYQQEKEEPIGKKLFGHKMRVTLETSRLVQEAVFEAGGSWLWGNTTVRNLDMECLYISKGGKITYSSVYGDSFKDDRSPEIQVSAKSVLVIGDIVKRGTMRKHCSYLQREETLSKISSLEEQLKQLKESLGE